MATPLSGVVGAGLTVNAYKAARFGANQPAQQGAFPQPPYTVYGGSPVSQAAPAAPDATTTADAAGNWSLNAPTAEDYIVCSVSGGNVQAVFFYPYVATNAQKRVQLSPAPAGGSAVGSLLTFTAFTPATYTTADLSVAEFSELEIDFDLTALTAGTAQLLVDRKSASGGYFPIATCVAMTGAGTQVLSIGKGYPQSATLGTATGVSAFSVSEAMGDTIRIRVIVATGNATATLSVKAK